MSNEAPRSNESLAASPWAAAVRSVEGKASVVLAALSVLGGLLNMASDILTKTGLSFLVSYPWNLVIFPSLFVAALFLYVRELRHVRRRTVRPTTTAFIGADPFTERDRARFFGRSDEIGEITRKLVDEAAPARFLILYGESGCGKTSLIRAGVIPELRQQHHAEAIYLRVFNRPVASLRQALQSVKQAGDAAPSGGDARPSPASLFDELRAARERSGRRLFVLFVDQFEEFFTGQIPAEERQQVFDLVRSVVSDPSPDSAKVVFSLRRDFFDHMTEFEDYVEDVFQRLNRKRIDPFGRERARTVINSSLRSGEPAQGAAWTDDLVERVLKDLEIERRGGVPGETEPIVLPAELQIVCQMVQRRGWSEERQYTGKERLIRDYLNDAVETSPNPLLSKQVLLALIHENGITRTPPQTPAEIAAKVSALTEDAARRHLEYLDRDCRLVTQVVRQGAPDGAREVAYELAHEYLVGVINSLSGAAMDESRRANVALQEHRTRRALNSKHRVPLDDVWRIRRRATIALTAEDRRMLRRSERTTLARASAAILLPALLVSALHLSVAHFAVQNESGTVVVRRGLPWLTPLLGSDTPAVDTGLLPEELTKVGGDACRKNSWVLNLWPAGGRGWGAPLRRWYVDQLYTKLNSDDVSEVSGAASNLLALNVKDDAITASLLKQLNKLSSADEDSFEDYELSTFVPNFIILLRHQGVKEEAIANQLRRQLVAPSGVSRVALTELLKMGYRDEEVVNALRKYLNSDSVGPRHTVERVPDLSNSKAFSEFHFIDDRPSKVSGELEMLEIDTPPKSSTFPLLDIFLVDFDRARDAWVLDFLKDKLLRGDTEEVAAATDTLLKLKVTDPWVRELLIKRLTDEDHETTLTAADRLLNMGERGDAVVAVLQHNLSDEQYHHYITVIDRDPFFWAAADVCVRHGIGDDWVRQPLLHKLTGDTAGADKDARKAETPNDAREAEEAQNLREAESALAADLLVRLKVRDDSLVEGLVKRMDSPAAKTGEVERALVELNARDGKVVAALRDRLGDSDPDKAGVIAAAMLRLGSQDDNVRKALLACVAGCKTDKGFGAAVDALGDWGASQPLADALRDRFDDPDAKKFVVDSMVRRKIRDDAIIRKLEKLMLDRYSRDTSVFDAYIRLVLLAPDQTFEQNAERLVEAMGSPDADQSSPYRRALQNAITKLAREQLAAKEIDRQEKIGRVELIRSKLARLMASPEMHLQITAHALSDNLELLQGASRAGQPLKIEDE